MGRSEDPVAELPGDVTQQHSGARCIQILPCPAPPQPPGPLTVPFLFYKPVALSWVS